jgi:DUF971 family protein
MPTYFANQDRDILDAIRQHVGEVAQVERHPATGRVEVVVGQLHGAYRSNVIGTPDPNSELVTIVHVGQSRVRIERDDHWLFFTAADEPPEIAEPITTTGPLDVVAARLDRGNVVGYEQAEVVERLAPDAWRVVFEDGHSAGIFEHELRVRPGDVGRLRAMEVSRTRL